MIKAIKAVLAFLVFALVFVLFKEAIDRVILVGMLAIAFAPEAANGAGKLIHRIRR